MEIILKYAICWIWLVVIAIVNGAVREKGDGQIMGALAAHQLITKCFYRLDVFS